MDDKKEIFKDVDENKENSLIPFDQLVGVQTDLEDSEWPLRGQGSSTMGSIDKEIDNGFDEIPWELDNPTTPPLSHHATTKPPQSHHLSKTEQAINDIADEIIKVKKKEEKPKRKKPENYDHLKDETGRSKAAGKQIIGLNKTGHENQPCVVDVSQRGKSNEGIYQDSYPEIAFDILSGGPLRSTAFLASGFKCSKTTINIWIKTKPEFRKQVEKGLACGEKLFREKCINHAFKPAHKVNNGLIKLFANNVYGIKEDSPPPVNVDISVHGETAEEIMVQRGIPIPSFSTPDIELTEDDGSNLDLLEKEMEDTNKLKIGNVETIYNPAEKAIAKKENKKRESDKKSNAKKAANIMKKKAIEEGETEEVAQMVYDLSFKKIMKETSGKPGRPSKEILLKRKLRLNMEKLQAEKAEQNIFDGKEIKMIDPDSSIEENLSPETRSKLDLLNAILTPKNKIQGMGPDFNNTDVVTGVDPFGTKAE